LAVPGSKEQKSTRSQSRKIYFLRSTNFNLLSKIKGYTINSCDFFEVNVFLLPAVIVITRHGSQNPTYVTDQATGDTVGAEGLTSTTKSGNIF